jgi:hypothetical protein
VFLYASVPEGLAFLENLDDTSWGAYAAAVYDAAVKRRDDEAEGPAP